MIAADHLPDYEMAEEPGDIIRFKPIDRETYDATLAEVEAGRLGTLQIINGSEVLLGAPTVFNAENVDDFDF